MSQKESLSQYSCYNYTFPSQSRNGANSLNPNTFSENTLTSRKAIDSSDCLSLSTSHYVRMLKQKYQRNGRENRHKNKVFEKCSAYHQSLPTTTSIGNHSSFEDENARKQSHETENEVVLQSPIRKTRIVSGNDDEFATYREALVKQATIENETLSSIEIQQLFQQQLVFQEELRTIQNNLQNLEEILKEAQYDRTQQDKNLQNFMQKFEEKFKANIERMKDNISSSIQETKQLLSFKLVELHNTIAEIHSCLLASTETIPNEQEEDVTFNQK